MKGYKTVFAVYMAWVIIVILGIIFTPDKIGFTEKPIGTLVELLVWPFAFGAALFLIIEAGKRLIK